jgi:lipopolysaccharide biosynthesis glycosyltransferase
MKIYIGYDTHEIPAYNTLVKSLARYSKIVPEPLISERLQAYGLLRRSVDNRGQMYDFSSGAPCSTEFAVSRFLVPIICQSGWALFMDCDMIFMDDPQILMQYADTSKAVMVVKHNHFGTEKDKMGGMVQTSYPRKNWSSVMLFNCDHPSNKRLNLDSINNRPGRDLHAFYWLHDSEIGELPAEWNWLVNVETKPDYPKIAHYTLGGPWINGWKTQPYDEMWLDASNNY